MTRTLRLGVNIDHVATIRNARGGGHPDPLRAAKVVAKAGADGITAHLREDRRHISDDDITRLSRDVELPLNLEMAATDEMLEIALRHTPHAACLVPEKRLERTTEGGLDVLAGGDRLASTIEALGTAGIRVSLFIEPDAAQLDAARALGAQVVELHTGAYCDAPVEGRAAQLERIAAAAAHAERIGLGMPRRPRPHLRHGRPGGGHPHHRRAQHRPFPGRRSHLRRPGKRHKAHALADGQDARRSHRGHGVPPYSKCRGRPRDPRRAFGVTMAHHETVTR